MTKHRWQEAEEFLKESDPILKEVIEKYGSCTLKPKENYFASLCESIVCQQISTKAAFSIMKRFNSLFTQGIAEPEALIRLSDERLREAGLSKQKIKYIQDLTLKVLEGIVNFANYSSLSNEEIKDQLMQVKGIGPWTVTMFLVFSLNRQDILPVGDLGIKKAFQVLYRLNDLPTIQEMNQIAKKWQPYKTIASWYLWRSLENK